MVITLSLMWVGSQESGVLGPKTLRANSMLVTDIGDKNVGDNLRPNCPAEYLPEIQLFVITTSIE